MTKMKKKLLLIVSLCLLAISVFGCGSDGNATYNGFTAEELAQNNTNILDTLIGMSDEDLAMIQMQGGDEAADPTIKVVNAWVEMKGELGEFREYGDVTVTEANGTTTVDQTAKFAKSDVKVSFVYDKDMNVTDISVDRIYTMGETMAKAGLNTAMGMGTVFIMLIAISLIIYCFKFINAAQNKASDKQAAPAVAPAVPAPVEEPQSETDDLELVAVIAAAIAAATGSSTDDFVVRSIKRR